MPRLTGLWRANRAAVLAGCALAAAVLAGALVWPLTDLLAAHDVGTLAGPLRAAHLQTAREVVRTQLLALVAGLLAAAAVAYIARSLTLWRRSVDVTGQGQLTERYIRAVEELGSEKLDVRIGGIYALEGVARDSVTDHTTVMEVLSAFIREHSGEQWPTRNHDGAEPGRLMRPDVQAALTVLGRRDPRRGSQVIDLAGANLDRARLARANLAGADLAGTSLADADLTGANLSRAVLTGASLTRVNLTDALLIGGMLTRARLTRADLTRATLTGADLTGTDFGYADLTDAFLIGAHLTETNLSGANLTGVSWPKEADAPKDWQRDSGSGRLTPAGTNSGDATDD